jgi:hypothetical protein
MINETLKNLVKAIGISILLSGAFSAVFGAAAAAASLIFGFPATQVAREVISISVSSFVLSSPIVWLAAFALLQKRLVKSSALQL